MNFLTSLNFDDVQIKGTPINCDYLAETAEKRPPNEDHSYWKNAAKFLRETHGKTPSELSTAQIKWLGSLRQSLNHLDGDEEDTPFNTDPNKRTNVRIESQS